MKHPHIRRVYTLCKTLAMPTDRPIKRLKTLPIYTILVTKSYLREISKDTKSQLIRNT